MELKRVTVTGWIIATLLMFAAPFLTAQETAQQPVSKPVTNPEDDSRIPVLLITGANNHDWKWTSRNLVKVLEACGRFHVTITNKPAETLAQPKELAKYAAFVLDYNGPRWGEAAELNFLEAVKSGTGVSVIHAANNSFPGWVEYEKLVALCWRKGTGHGRFHLFPVDVVDRDHPITKDMVDMRNHPDELYHRLVPMHGTDYRVLATAHSSKKSKGTGKAEPMIIVKNYGKGRIFHTPLGHVWTNVPGSRASFADPQFRHLICRGTEWAATGKVTLPASVPNFLTAAEKTEGFLLIFNGRNLDGWRGFRQKAAPTKGWSAMQGTLHHAERGGGGNIITVDEYGDFDLRFEWKVANKSNSGVIYHAQDRLSEPYWTGLEYQILDDAHLPKTAPRHGAAGLYDLVIPVGKVLAKTGSWNTGRILVKGGRAQHYVNGVKVVDTPIEGSEWDALVAGSKFKTWKEFGKYSKGHIAFQDHGNAVWYRTIRIKSFDE